MAVVISLKLVYTPVDDNITTPLCSKQASKHRGKMTAMKPSPNHPSVASVATPAKRGIGPGCWTTEVGGPVGRLHAAGRAYGR